MIQIPRTRMAVCALGLMTALSMGAQAADSQLRISSTERLITANPYGDSNGQMYSIWCQIYGCLGIYDWAEKKYVGMIAESWEVVDPKTWRFHLRTDLKRQDGGPGPTATDVVHSYQRIKTDPDSAQQSSIADIADVTAVGDDHTVDFHTKAPDAPLLSFLFDRFIVTSDDLFKRYGKDADQKAAIGWGPYKLAEFVIDQRVVMNRYDDYPGIDPATPKRVIYQTIGEPEQRVTALLNGEVDIARLIPPQLVGQLEKRTDFNIVRTGSIEQMFIGMNVKMKPWDNVKLRQAVSHAIDRDLIIKKLLNGQADRLDGPIGSKSEICYNGGTPGAYSYDPALSKKLLAEAGYPNGGPEIDFLTSNNRFILDRQISEVIAQMLGNVGFKVHLQALEYATLWASIRPGKAPMFYFARGSVFDPTRFHGAIFRDRRLASGRLFESGIR